MYENNSNGFPENQNCNGYSENQNQGYTYNPPLWQTPEPPKPEEPQNDKRSKRPGIGVIIAVALSCSIVGAAVGSAGTLLISDKSIFGNTSITSINEGQREDSVLDINYIDTSKIMTAAEIYAVNVNSTVGITTSITTNFFGYQTTSAASGSGFILTEDGYIVTNNHVIEGASSIKVTTYSGSAYEATLVGYDESNDLAVLKIDAKGLTPVILGDSDNMNVGDDVVAIGNPLGELTFSLTSGSVSALDREVTMSSGISMDLIQTDCAINSGNSGGALFNMYGEVIGITNAKYSSSSSSQASIDNIGFAIPINNVRKIIESIIETGDIVKPYIGIAVGDVSSQNQNYGVPAGASVQSVTDGSPAQTAGLKANDVITAVDGTAIKSGKELQKIVYDSSAGDVLTLTVYRQGQTLEIKVTVDVKRQSALDGSGSQEEDGSTFFNPFDRFFG